MIPCRPVLGNIFGSLCYIPVASLMRTLLCCIGQLMSVERGGHPRCLSMCAGHLPGFSSTCS